MTLHGNAWEFFRNHNLNARNFFAPSTPKLIQNQFGGTLGGPIKKNKLFAFGSYEGLRVRPATLVTSPFPLTEAERQGVFTTPVRDPLTNQPFPGNRIPPERFDPVANEILKRNLMPLPNSPDGQYITTFASPQDNNNILARLDYNAGLTPSKAVTTTTTRPVVPSADRFPTTSRSSRAIAPIRLTSAIPG